MSISNIIIALNIRFLEYHSLNDVGNLLNMYRLLYLEDQRPYMYNIPYVQIYVAFDMKCITLVLIHVLRLLQLVLATGFGNLPAVWVWTAKTSRFGSRPIQKPDPLPLGGPNPDPYPATCRFCWVWLDSSGPISGFVFRVSLFIVAFRYATVKHKILTLVRS